MWARWNRTLPDRLPVKFRLKSAEKALYAFLLYQEQAPRIRHVSPTKIKMSANNRAIDLEHARHTTPRPPTRHDELLGDAIGLSQRGISVRLTVPGIHRKAKSTNA